MSGAKKLLAALAAVVTTFGASGAAAQRPIDQGVRIGITYAPGTRPGMLVLGGERGVVQDSVRAILNRDLDYSDQFEMIFLPAGDSLTVGVRQGNHGGGTPDNVFVNYPLYAALGAHYAINVAGGGDSALAVTVYDVLGEVRTASLLLAATDTAGPDFRQAVHRMADEIVRLTTGAPGIAASRILWVGARALRVLDSDGYSDRGLETVGQTYSPSWHPDGNHFAYVEFPGVTKIHISALLGGEDRTIDVGAEGQDFAPSFGPNGNILVFARAGDEGTDVYSYNFRDECCLERLTVGRFSDNLSPTFSPDGRRIAYVSTRSGLPQIYVMASDGTGQELFAPFDYGVTGGSYAPEWSPDGLNLAFHRDVAGSPQVFIMHVATRTVRQLTSAGRNEDPTWGPDGRHLAFVSDRTGISQIWVIDLETGRTRQLTKEGSARLPAWSGRLAVN